MLVPERFRRRAVIAVCAALLVAAGCGKKKSTEPLPPPPPAPVPNSPANLLSLIEYCWDYRDTSSYRDVFTGDFRFCFAADDSSGNAYPNCSWTRDDELAMARALFQTGLPGQSRARTIDLRFTNNPVVMPDPRPGKDAIWHKNIRTTVVLSVTTVDGNTTNITGFANYFMTRGDSAAIPPDLVARGFQPNSTRWYLDGWEDETTHTPSASRAQPTRQVTWGYLKVQYTDGPAPSPAPTPNSAQNAVRLLEWSYNQYDGPAYGELFTGDYRFVFDAADSAGLPWRDRPFARGEELTSSSRLFNEAADLRLAFGRSFTTQPDPRRPDSTDWYRLIRTTVSLIVRDSDGGATHVTGLADFFLVRGDVALIPEELGNRGFRPDVNRWYINRWEDKTAGSGAVAQSRALRGARPARAMASRQVSWGRVKALYL